MLNTAVKTFLEAADSGSFSAASQSLYLSKVSVMNQINTLEKQVGVQLLTRTNHGVSLTEAGQSFYRNMRKVQRLSDAAVEEAQKIGGRRDRVIRIGTSLMRPCNRLVELWEHIPLPRPEVQFHIVPFDDGIDSLNALLAGLGSRIDCFMTPCSSTRLLMNYSFLPIDTCQYEIAMSKKHRLAGKAALTWEDMTGESLLLVNRGESYVVDAIRDEIALRHPQIQVMDFNGFYDATTFNMCEQMGYLMGTMDLWSRLHPSLVTVPVKWDYTMPYGIMYAKEPTGMMREFIGTIESKLKVLR